MLSPLPEGLAYVFARATLGLDVVHLRFVSAPPSCYIRLSPYEAIPTGRSREAGNGPSDLDHVVVNRNPLAAFIHSVACLVLLDVALASTCSRSDEKRSRIARHW